MPDRRLWTATGLHGVGRQWLWGVPLILGFVGIVIFVVLAVLCGVLDILICILNTIPTGGKASYVMPPTWVISLALGVLALAGPLALAGFVIRRRKLHAILAENDDLPFPVIGYAWWLCADAPVFDVVFERAVDEPVQRELSMVVQPTMRLWTVDEHRLRFAMPPIPFHARRVAYRPVGRHVLTRILTPLHARYGIVVVEMGGFRAPGR